MGPTKWGQMANYWCQCTCSRGKQRFICESNTTKAQDICLDTEQNVCHLEIHPDETPETVLAYVGNGCICVRTLYNSTFIDNTTAGQIITQMFLFVLLPKSWDATNYSAPVTTYQWLQSSYTSYQDILLTPTGMNLTLVRKLLQHDDPSQLLTRIQNNKEPWLLSTTTQRRTTTS